MRHIIKVSIIISLFFIFTYLPAEEEIEYQVPPSPEAYTYSREEAQQHYQQGKEFYYQGRYEEATTEFQKAETLITPSTHDIEFMKRVQKEQEKALSPTSQEATKQTATIESQKAMTLTIPSEIELMEKVQKEEEKTLAPASAPKKAPLSAKEKLARKKKGRKEEDKEIGVTAAVEAKGRELTPEAEEREYYIDLGDVLDISVWQIPDLSRPEVIVRPDGKISFPLIGDVKVEGLTLTQLDKIITERLKEYVKAPEVSIMMRRFGAQANKVIILGEIPAPGVYRFSTPPTITEVIASAGGYTKYAVLNSIMIISGDVRTNPEVTKVDLAQVIKAGRLTENVILKPNDIVYVPRSLIGNINTFLEIFQPAISEYIQTLNVRRFQQIIHRNAQ